MSSYRDSNDTRLYGDCLISFDRDHLYEAAARSDIEKLEGLPVGQLLAQLLLVVKLGEVLRGIAAIAVEDDEEIRSFGDVVKFVLAGLLIRLSMVDRRIGGNLPEAVPVVNLLVAELIVGEIPADQPDVGFLVVELVLGRCEVPANAACRSVGRRGFMPRSDPCV